MAELLIDLEKKREIEELCNEHSLNISLLKQLFYYSMKGFNNNEIAQKLGVHRVTIQRYSSALKRIKESDFEKIYDYVLNEVEK